MSEVATETQVETQVPKKFDPEAFAMNLAKAMESSGQALAAYLKPRENGEAKGQAARTNSARWSRRFSAVAEYWLSDAKRDRQTCRPEARQGLSRSLGIIGAPACR